MARVLRWAARSAAGAVAVSKAVGRDARGVLGGLPIEVIYNAIDVDRFRPAPGDGRRLDELAGLPAAEPGTLRVGLVATFARWKGQDLFLDAAARVLRDRPGAKIRFYLIGGSIYHTHGSQFSEGELRDRAAGLAIARHVGFVGFQQNTADVYRALDVVVHASTRPEPFGLTIIEAMACAKPVVVARAGGAAELFVHGHDAVGVAPNDVRALASAVGWLADDPDSRRRIAENARRTAAARFSCRRLGPQVFALYNRFAKVPARLGAQGSDRPPADRETSVENNV
jgi:glycosyltransferase involved in cell wall biosynthesis